MFKKILVVNRGEIAIRLIRACREMGIKSAAVYSSADTFSLHTRIADESHFLGGAAPSESYLNISKIIELAKRIEADAIHPGYGFLSENADFIQAVEEAGITFIGPSSKSVKMMGSKTAARELMINNNVPIVPGTTTPIDSLDEAKKICEGIGYPVLLKASAGGGGKGMKKVFNSDELEEGFLSASREAKKAFGSSDVYIEKLIQNPKHIEVQIIADKHGNYRHLFERECSVQRRHQKVIEEAPSPSLDQETREKITLAAINAAKACNYHNAGTIEFLMDSDRKFYFLEMNTRLQVEHPVTELISGIDLVREQINIAFGKKISFNQEELVILGHSIEARVYAEDPDNNFLPTSGKIVYHRLPSGPGVRVDRGIDNGSFVGLNYDPLLTKLSVLGKNREIAISKMNIALSDYLIAGITTNISFLKWILKQDKFLDGSYSINFLEEEFIPLIPDKWKSFQNLSDVEAAALFSVLLRNKKKNKFDNKSQNNYSKWSELLNE
ncbi:MAG: acetyl-CoA carboxylase biotin carboxylase subunit [Ignavibacteriaceae bacterium]|nr:acetyl-CoA carboxylase biotin carboxylase subunit [Ignavibacteriaceae bacterium]